MAALLCRYDHEGQRGEGMIAVRFDIRFGFLVTLHTRKSRTCSSRGKCQSVVASLSGFLPTIDTSGYFIRLETIRPPFFDLLCPNSSDFTLYPSMFPCFVVVFLIRPVLTMNSRQLCLNTPGHRRHVVCTRTKHAWVVLFRGQSCTRSRLA